MSETHQVGQRRSFNGAPATIRYVGEVEGTTGSWLGIEWDDSTRGKHDGSHKGVKYFTCRSNSPTAASLIRPTRPADKPCSFIAALQDKYAPNDDPSNGNASEQIVFSGKVAEEVGFDKIRRQLAQVKELKIIILDGLTIDRARDEGEAEIGEMCPSITQLDLSRNLFVDLHPIADICSQLPNLRVLRLNGNRLQSKISNEQLSRCRQAFANVQELELKDTLLEWDGLCRIASACPKLTLLHVGSNQLTAVSDVDYSESLSDLTSLSLEYNDITSLSDVASLGQLKGLRNLHLKGNSIAALISDGAPTPKFSSALQYLDVSYNDIAEWDFVDALPSCFPGLTGLRISHNPVYDIKYEDSKASSSEEAHMLTIGRLATLENLNFSKVTADDRLNGEMFYLSRIAKQLAAAPETAEADILSTHPRYQELCKIYGAPDVIRQEEINPAFLEARLITCTFHMNGEQRITKRLPRTLDIYAVKSVVGKLFGLSPLKLRLTWETGEWDPVAGFDDEDEQEDSDGEDEIIAARLQSAPDPTNPEMNTRTGRWIKREAEMWDSPRQLGYVVDGSVASVRVEALGA